MRRRTRLISLVPVVLGAAVLASCGGDDGGYPPFEMTYTLSGSAGDQVWLLHYSTADDWTKRLLEDRTDPSAVGRTMKWDGSRVEVASGPDAEFVRDGSPEPIEHRAPELWFAYEPPNDLFEEVEDSLEGVRTFRNEYPFGADDSEDEALELLSVDAETGIPLRYLNVVPNFGRSLFTALALQVDGQDVDLGLPGDRDLCGRNLCQSHAAVVRGVGGGVDVFAWGFLPDQPVILRSTDPQVDRVEQHVQADGSVRVWIDPHAPEPPGEQYVLVQEQGDDLPMMWYWQLYVVDDQPIPQTLEATEFLQEIQREYRDVE